MRTKNSIYITNLLSFEPKLDIAISFKINLIKHKEAPGLIITSIFQYMAFFRGSYEGTIGKNSAICFCIITFHTNSITENLVYLLHYAEGIGLNKECGK